MSRRQITISEIIQDYGDSLKMTMYHTFPGVVSAYYSDGTVDVQPAVNDVRFDPDTQDRVSEPFAILPRVKVSYPSGGGYSITWPLQAGDKVTLHAYDLDPTVHRQTGGVEDPQDVRRHGGTYWQAVPGDITDAAPTPTAGQITITGPGNVALGAAADFVALASKVAAEFTAIKATLATGSNGAGAVVFATPYTGPNPLGSSKVKA